MNNEELDLLTKLQPRIREAMGEHKGHDLLHCLTCGAYFTKNDDDCNCNEYKLEKWISIPLAIDPVNPRRGLWGMIDWYLWDMTNRPTGRVSLYGTEGENILNCTIYLALLKALDAQIVEVKG